MRPVQGVLVGEVLRGEADFPVQDPAVNVTVGVAFHFRADIGWGEADCVQYVSPIASGVAFHDDAAVMPSVDGEAWFVIVVGGACPFAALVAATVVF